MDTLTELGVPLQILLICLELLHDFDKKLDGIVLALHLGRCDGMFHDLFQIVHIGEHLFKQLDHVIDTYAGKGLLNLTLLVRENGFLKEIDSVIGMYLRE